MTDVMGGKKHIKSDLQSLPIPQTMRPHFFEGLIPLKIKENFKLLWLSWKIEFWLFAFLSYGSSHLKTASSSFTFLFNIFWRSIKQSLSISHQFLNIPKLKLF